MKHFEAEGVFRSTTYNIIYIYLRKGNVDHKKGGGRPVNVMTPYKKQRLRQTVNHKTGLSQRNFAGRFDCSQTYISKTLAPGYSNPIKCCKRVKTPYNASAEKINNTKIKCRKLYNHTAGKLIVMDDKNYFGLTGYQMSGNIPQPETLAD